MTPGMHPWLPQNATLRTTPPLCKLTIVRSIWSEVHSSTKIHVIHNAEIPHPKEMHQILVLEESFMRRVLLSNSFVYNFLDMRHIHAYYRFTHSSMRNEPSRYQQRNADVLVKKNHSLDLSAQTLDFNWLYHNLGKENCSSFSIKRPNSETYMAFYNSHNSEKGNFTSSLTAYTLTCQSFIFRWGTLTCETPSSRNKLNKPSFWNIEP